MRPIGLSIPNALPAITIYGPRPDPAIGAVIDWIGHPVSFACDVDAGTAMHKSAARFGAEAPAIGAPLDAARAHGIIDSVFDPSERHRLLYPGTYRTSCRCFEIVPRKRERCAVTSDDVESAARHLLPYYRAILPHLPVPLDTALALRGAIRALLPDDTCDLPEEYGLGLRSRRLLTGNALLLSHVMGDVDLFRFVEAHAGGIDLSLERRDSWSDVAFVNRDGRQHLRCDAILTCAGSLYADRIEALLKEHGCSCADLTQSLALLRYPLFQEGRVGAGHAGRFAYADRVAAEVGRIVHAAHERQERRLSIVLGGTLFPEIQAVAAMVEQALADAHRARPQGLSFEAWVEGWDLSILGYSIDLELLRGMEQKVHATAFPEWLKRSIRLEYIDLLDSSQWPRLLAAKPQLIAVIRSLYITMTLDALRQLLAIEPNPVMNMKLARSLCFADFAMRILPAGGLFITEPGASVLPHHDGFRPYMDQRIFTGILVKTEHRRQEGS
jgi:hypothetical protein